MITALDDVCYSCVPFSQIGRYRAGSVELVVGGIRRLVPAFPSLKLAYRCRNIYSGIV